MHARFRRLVLWTVVCLLGAECLWLVGANFLLASSYGRDLANRRPDRFQAQWQSAWTLWPGHLRVGGLELRVQGRKATWALDLAQARARLELLPLLRRQVRFATVAAGGAAFRLVRPGAEAESAAPPFPAFDGLPQVERPRPRDPWRLTFSDATVDGVRELWIDSLRYEPDAADAASAGDGAAGRLELAVDIEPRTRIGVSRARIDLAPGALRLGERAVGTLRVAGFDGRLDGFEPSVARGGRWLRAVHGVVELAVEEAEVAPLEYYFRGLPVRMRGAGDVEASVRLRGAVLEPPSRLEVAAAQLEVDFARSSATGRGRLKMTVAPAPSPVAELHLELDEYRLGHLEAETKEIVGGVLTLDATTPTLDLLDAEPDVTATVRVGEAQIPSFAAFDASLPAGVPLELLDGSGRFDATVRFASAEKRASATMRLEGEDVRARWNEFGLAGDLVLDVSMPDGALNAERFQLGTATLDLTDVVVEGAEGEGRRRGARRRAAQSAPWWLHARLEGGTFEPARPFRLATRIDASCADSRPLIALLQERKPAVGWLAETLVVHDLDVTTALRTEANTLMIQDLTLRGGKSLEARAGLRFAGERPDGAVWISWGPVAAAVAFDGEETDWSLRHSERWFERRVAALGLDAAAEVASPETLSPEAVGPETLNPEAVSPETESSETESSETESSETESSKTGG
ncbi:MAG: hypothetical protein AAGC60_23740 [Acidobacteriota bacterium]